VPCALSIGAFDGVHIGHRRLLNRLLDVARAQTLPAVVVTFDRHPASVVRAASAPAILTEMDLKLELLSEIGVDEVLVMPFDENRANESAEEFVNETLVNGLHAKAVVVGENFHFGHGRKGNVALLEEMGRLDGFSVEGFSLSEEEGDVVSATRIRALVAKGDVAMAGHLLERAHRVRGRVVEGDKRGGKELGFPTANITAASDVAMPAVGIYAGWYRRPDGSRHGAAISIGRRPTFYAEGAPPLLEAHLLDFSGNLYGEIGDVAFVERLRDEERYDSVEALVEQIGRDVAATRAVLGL